MKNLNTYRKTWAEIDLNAITHNLNQLKSRVGAENKMLAAVKADAYGHGLVEVSRHLEKIGIDFLGTSSIDEALELRASLVKCPILSLNNLLPPEIEAIIRNKIRPSIADVKTAKLLNKEAAKLKIKVPVHIKIDTGMGRIGIWHKNAEGFFREVKSLSNLIIEGIYTHFPAAETDNKFTIEQINVFDKLINEIKTWGICPSYLHTANSAGILNYKKAHFNLVRPGLAIYGIEPAAATEIKLKPALTLKSQVAYIKRVSKGMSVSYGRTFVAKEDTDIATLPIGYADGYSHLFSNKGRVLIKGNYYSVAGRVCMDQTMVDIGLNNDVKVGDEVVLIGSQGGKNISVKDLAQICSTIPYQVLCWISKRVPRIYS